MTDPETGEERPCRFRDVAILYRTRTGLEAYERAMEALGVPYLHAGPPRAKDRQEIQDLLTALRLVDNPRDDLRAFAFLRSPFVGLRDEVLARIRLQSPFRPFLEAARAYLQRDEWHEPPEGPRVPELEREALLRGLDAMEEAMALSTRVALDELLDGLLERTGYQAHLHLLERSDESLANVQGFLHMLEAYRSRPLGSFLEIWDRWEDQDPGIPQAALASREDDVVTLTTIHSAKGLEWPVVFLVDAGQSFTLLRSNTLWSDRQLGPVLCPKQHDRGVRTMRLAERWEKEERAEEARLLYVAATRARDRFVVVGEHGDLNAPTAKAKSHADWLARGIRRAGVEPRREPAPVPERPPAPAVRLSWLDRVVEAPPPPALAPFPEPALRWVTSATELMARRKDRKEWALRYRHGVQPSWEFARTGTGDGLPARARGSLVHGVLERIEHEAEVAELLDEAVAALDAPELTEALRPGSLYRKELEEEIRRVVSGTEWAWYVEGEHHRELAFVHLAAPREWRVGSFDLFRPDGWIIDFKTHRVGAREVERVAAEYAVQAEVYRAAAEVVGPARIRLHFTVPAVVVDVRTPRGG